MSLDASCEEDVVTFKEACEEEKIREENAIAVFGAADENNCSYTLGYMVRQAVFTCTTCDPSNTKEAGVCYACAVHCHQGHELVELYTKRNFRCDCGNSRFDEKCKLYEEKDEVNSLNHYDHNFKGKYCTCDRPYPDPEDEIEDDMIQCILCEDWFHSRHLGCLAPAEYSEMICDQCIQKHPFLKLYKDYEVPPVVVVANGETDENINVTSTEDTSSKVGSNSSTDDNSGCVLERLKEKHGEIPKEGLVVMYLEEGWRGKLCLCEKCMELYRSHGISYLTNEEDTIKCYEEKGKENVEKVWEEAATTISNMNKVQQVELMHGYHQLKSGLEEFVNGFAEGQVIRKEDVECFFEKLNQKRRRLNDAPPM